MTTTTLTDRLAALAARARRLATLLPGSSAFRNADINTKIKALFYATAFFAVTAIGAYGYFNASSAYRERAVQLLESSRNEVAANIEELIEMQRNDLGFLNNFYAFLRFVYWKDLGDTAKMEEWRNIAGDTLRNFAEHNSYFSKIRLVDPTGQELLHIVTDNVSGKASVMDEEHLLNVADLDYFKAARKLKRGELYVSELDFERKDNQVEKPLVPVVRFIQPLVGANNVTYGLTITNIRASALFDYIRDANKNSQNRQFTLIDSAGNYLFHPDADKQFGHLLGNGHTFNKDHHNLLAEMQGKTEGVITRGGHIHVFRAIVPNPRQPELRWFLVGVVDENVALAELNTFIAIFTGLLVVLIFVIIAATRYMSSQLMTPLQFVSRQLEMLARGETRPESIDYPAQDAIREMLDATGRVVTNIDVLARQADAIAGGDFSGQVVPLSENDRLGTALNNMTRQLAENQRENAQRNWHKDGLAELVRNLTGDLTPQRLAELAISQVGRTLEAGRGVLYVWNEDEKVLDLLGSFMYTECNSLGARVRPGEGAVGQVARELKPIILHTTDDTRADLPPITTGTTNVAPNITYTWPLQREGVLQGVLEIARSAALDPTQLAYLNAATENIAAFLYAVLLQSRIKDLLVISEEATRQAQEQSRQLAATNTQMEEQQQQLQQQTAELQAANSQMEEQQQQLQQQTAELQAANAQMEETQQALEQRNRDLLSSQEELDARARLLELSSKYKSEFLANMSHELRTPLNSIILLAKMMASNEDNNLGVEEVKRADVIHRAGQDLLHLINDVLDLSKVEAGRMELHSAPVASSTLAEEFRDLFSLSAIDKGLELKVVDTITAEINVDRDKLSQIVRNLLSNAIKFTRTGSVTLRFYRGRQEDALPLRISVSDTGIGVAPEKQALIFEAFQQADGSTSREYGGTGLGLSISLSIAHLMGGDIELASTPGQGSCFTLLLPGTPPAHAVHNEKHRLKATFGHGADLTVHGAQTSPVPAAGHSVLRVPDSAAPSPEQDWPADDRESIGDNDPLLLVIDDDPVFARAILSINRRQGYKTLLSAFGGAGLTLARSFNPNGILLDLGLPDMDGSLVLHALKSAPELAKIPVYIVSSRDHDNALMGLGAIGWLRKPVDAEQIARIEAEVLASSLTSGCNLLLLVNGTLNEEEMVPLLGSEYGALLTLSVGEFSMEKLSALTHTSGDCRIAILDLGDTPASLAAARQVAMQLHSGRPDIGLLFYGGKPLGDEDEAQLRQFSDSIIIRSPQAERRLQENIAYFLGQMPRRHRGAIVPGKPAGSGKKRLAGRHILVVDDDPRNLFVITAALEQHGARVENALNGRKALELLAASKPDLVVMDIMMPEMDGYTAIEAMRADTSLATIPVLALTAKALPGDRTKALAAGADDYLAKPADYEVLVNMAAALCEGRR
jgi:signal transduction histidine kinase/DNA-binding response OmpR family regulator